MRTLSRTRRRGVWSTGGCVRSRGRVRAGMGRCWSGSRAKPKLWRTLVRCGMVHCDVPSTKKQGRNMCRSSPRSTVYAFGPLPDGFCQISVCLFVLQILFFSYHMLYHNVHYYPPRTPTYPLLLLLLMLLCRFPTRTSAGCVAAACHLS